MRSRRQDLRLALLELAGQQRGYFTAAQAKDIGYSYQAQKFHVDHGNWVRVERGVFRMHGWPGGDDDHLVRWTMWSGGVAVVSHESALSAHDLGDVDPAHVHLTVPPGFRKRAESVVLHRQDVGDSDIEEREGYRVTVPPRALAECAAAGLAQELLDGAMGEALARGLASRRRLRDAAALLGSRAELGVERALQAVAR